MAIYQAFRGGLGTSDCNKDRYDPNTHSGTHNQDGYYGNYSTHLKFPCNIRNTGLPAPSDVKVGDVIQIALTGCASVLDNLSIETQNYGGFQFTLRVNNMLGTTQTPDVGAVRNFTHTYSPFAIASTASYVGLGTQEAVVISDGIGLYMPKAGVIEMLVTALPAGGLVEYPNFDLFYAWHNLRVCKSHEF